MQAKQCDRCGALYPTYSNPKYKLTAIAQTTSRYTKSIDLCKNCVASLAKWYEDYYVRPEDIEREKKANEDKKN